MSLLELIDLLAVRFGEHLRYSHDGWPMVARQRDAYDGAIA